MVNIIAYAVMSGGNPFHLLCEALYFKLLEVQKYRLKVISPILVISQVLNKWR